MLRTRPRSGVVLLEVLVSLAILGVVGASAAALATDAGNVVRLAHRADAETRRASALLESVALWPREDLDRHLGTRAQGELLMDVARPSASLYTVAIRDSSGRSLILATSLFRPTSPTSGASDAH